MTAVEERIEMQRQEIKRVWWPNGTKHPSPAVGSDDSDGGPSAASLSIWDVWIASFSLSVPAYYKGCYAYLI